MSELHDAARQLLAGIGLAADEPTTWTHIAELGWLMVSLDEARGGLGLGLAGACALHMELGRALGTVPLLPALLAIDAIGQADIPGREQWLQRLSAGDDYVATSLAGSALTVVSVNPGELRLSGVAMAVPSADRAGHALVCSESGDCVALVSLEQSGVTITPRPTWDTTRRLFDLQFADVALDSGLVLATGAAARRLTRSLSLQRDLSLAADAVGGAAALLELTVEYLKTREQFGRPLALFQALKHRCADLKAQTEAAHALLQDRLSRLDGLPDQERGLAEAESMGRAAKQLACTTYAVVAEEALQLHGGIGMTSEHQCHLFLKRAMLNEHLGDTADRYDIALAETLLERL